MNSSKPRAWSDEDILEALHLRDNENMKAADIARRVGFSRSSVLGQFHRIRTAEVEGDAGDCSMPPRWWRR